MRNLATAFCVAMLAAIVPAQAADHVIRWGDVVGGSHPSVLMIDRVAAEVKAKTNGRVEVHGFPNGQLGSSRDMIEAVANGTQQIVTEGAANFGAWLPSVSVVEAPYIWRDPQHQAAALNGAIGAEYQRATDQGARHAHPRLDLLRHAARHHHEQGSEERGADGRIQDPRAGKRRVQGDGRSLGREAHADELQRTLSRAQAGRCRRTRESAADDQVGKVRRGSEIHRAHRATS